MYQLFHSRGGGLHYSAAATAAVLVSLVFTLFAIPALTPVASANPASGALTLVSKHAKVVGGVAAITIKAKRAFDGTVRLEAGASPGVTKTVFYSKAVIMNYLGLKAEVSVAGTPA